MTVFHSLHFETINLQCTEDAVVTSNYSRYIFYTLQEKKVRKTTMCSDVEHFLESFWIQSSNSRNFPLRILAAYIINILLQFVVLPQLFVSMSAVIKENTKK